MITGNLDEILKIREENVARIEKCRNAIKRANARKKLSDKFKKRIIENAQTTMTKCSGIIDGIDIVIERLLNDM